MNDPRDVPQISASELIRLFIEEYTQNGHEIADLSNTEAVMTDLLTKVNMPFRMIDHKRDDGKTLMAKTVMRKSNFVTPDRKYFVR